MKQRNRIWVILILILLLVGLTVGYWYLTRTPKEVSGGNLGVTKGADQEDSGAVIPDQGTPATEVLGSEDLLEDLNIATVDLVILRSAHPKMKNYYKLEEQVQGYINELSRQQDDYKLADEQVQAQNSDLTIQLNTQLENIKNKYQKEIDDKIEALQDELLAFEEETWNKAVAEIQRKKDDLEKLAEEMIVKYHERQTTELQTFQEELSTEYAAKTLNLRLKLQLVQLTEEEQKKYQSELDKLQLEQQKILEDKSVELENQINQFIEDKQNELDSELKSFQKNTEQEAQAVLEAKQAELDKFLKDFIADREQEMNKEFQERQTKLEEQAKTSLINTQKEIQQEIQKKEEMLQNDLEKAQAEQSQLLEEIDQEIKSIVSEIAEKTGIDLVLTDVRVSVNAVDLTQQALQKLKQ